MLCDKSFRRCAIVDPLPAIFVGDYEACIARETVGASVEKRICGKTRVFYRVYQQHRQRKTLIFLRRVKKLMVMSSTWRCAVVSESFDVNGSGVHGIHFSRDVMLQLGQRPDPLAQVLAQGWGSS